MNFDSESSFKTVNMNQKEDDQIDKIVSDLDFDKIHVDDTKRRGLHNRNKCFSNDLPTNILDTRRSTEEASQGGGLLSSARSLLQVQDTFRSGRITVAPRVEEKVPALISPTSR